MAVLHPVACVLLMTAVSSLPWTTAWADEPAPPIVPLTATEVLEKKVLGKATVEFLVADVHELNIDSVFMPGKGHAQLITAEAPGAKGDVEFIVIITRDIATALLKSGIANVTEHFRHKQLRVSGAIQRIDRVAPGKTTYKLTVTRLDQLERVKAIAK